jgi:hypothetical protein
MSTTDSDGIKTLIEVDGDKGLPVSSDQTGTEEGDADVVIIHGLRTEVDSAGRVIAKMGTTAGNILANATSTSSSK